MWSAPYGAVQNGLSAADIRMGSYIYGGEFAGSLTKVKWKDPGLLYYTRVGRLRRLGILPIMCTRRDAFGVRGSSVSYLHTELHPDAEGVLHV